MMKSEKAMGELLKNVSKECHAEPITDQLRKIGKAFIGKCVVGAPEAAMKIMSKWLIRKSRKVQYVNSNVKDERVSLPKSKQLLEELEEDDDDDIYVTRIHDRCTAWPDDLEDMYLAKFAVMYDPSDQSSAHSSHEGLDLQDNIHDDDDDDDDDDSQVHVVKCNSGNLSSRKNEV